LDHKKLSEEYPAVQVYSSNSVIGHGNRVVYWVGSDGRQAVVFNCLGERFTVRNAELAMLSVVNAVAYSFEGGRLRYQRTLDAMWIDAGPVTEEALRPDDSSIGAIKGNVGRELTFDELATYDDDAWESDEW